MSVPSVRRACGVTKASAPKPVIYSPPIYGWFAEGFDTPVLQDAKAQLDNS